MSNPPFISSISIENFRSFASLQDFELRPLNVLIGATGSGKTNFINAIGAVASNHGPGLCNLFRDGACKGRIAVKTIAGERTMPMYATGSDGGTWHFPITGPSIQDQIIGYSPFDLSPESDVRDPIDERMYAKGENDYLTQGGWNLPLVIREMMKHCPERLPDMEIKEDGDNVSIVGIDRMPDGELQMLLLKAALFAPDAPKLVCIERPETALHFDVLSKLAEMLFQASRERQVIITTNSDSLLSDLVLEGFVLGDAGADEMIESVVVVEKDSEEQGTTMQRLEAGGVIPFLNDGERSLGDLWMMGELGGTGG